jgi:hypothetical protein
MCQAIVGACAGASPGFPLVIPSTDDKFVVPESECEFPVHKELNFLYAKVPYAFKYRDEAKAQESLSTPPTKE